MSDRRSSQRFKTDGRQPFSYFGPSIVSRVARRPTNRLVFGTDIESGRKQILKNIPVCPGVYGWINQAGTLTYVGKSKSLRHRLASYFSVSSTDSKMERIRRQSSSIVWEAISHDLLALIREQELIYRLRPPMNVQGKPERQQPGFVCIGKGQAPNAFFSNQITNRAAHSFGPVTGTGRVREAIIGLNYAFQLRDCPEKTPLTFNNQLTLFDDQVAAQCLRFELDTCPAPCAGRCSRESYQSNLARALKFLNCEDNSILDLLKNQMVAAAANLAYEKASVLRDRWNALNWVFRRLSQLRKSQRTLNGVLELPGFDHRKIWLLLAKGKLVDCVAKPVGSDAKRILQKQLPQALQSPREIPPQNSLEINWLLLLAAWDAETAGTCIQHRTVGSGP